jgi:hypothetical protein
MNSLGLKSKAMRRVSSHGEGKGVLINIEGLEKTGKNHLVGTGPGPQLWLCGDRNPYTVADKFNRDEKGKITAVWFRYAMRDLKDPNAVAKLVRPIYAEFEDLFWEAIDNNDKLRTVCVDTGSWAWETARLAAFGKLDKVPPFLYTRVNGRFERMLLGGEGTGKIVVWLHRLKEKWVDQKNESGEWVSKNTGKLITDGMKAVCFDMEVNLRTGRDEKGRFTATVLSNGIDPDVDGMTFRGNQCNLPTILSTLFGNDPADWT